MPAADLFSSAGPAKEEKKPVRDVLEVRECLALAPDEAARVLRLHIQEETVFQFVGFDFGFKAEEISNFFKVAMASAGIRGVRNRAWIGSDRGTGRFSRRGNHFLWRAAAGPAEAAATAGSLVLVTFICTMVNRFDTAQ